jgi:hypothetical protein
LLEVQKRKGKYAFLDLPDTSRVRPGSSNESNNGKTTREKTNTIYAKGDFDIFSLRILFAHLFNPFIAQFVLLMMHADLASALSLSSICAVLGVTGLSGHP